MSAPFELPENTEVIDPEGDAKRSALAKVTMAKMDELMKDHPEIHLSFVTLYTPPPPGTEPGIHDSIHTAIVTGEHAVAPEQMMFILKRVVGSLIGLMTELNEDPDKYSMTEN